MEAQPCKNPPVVHTDFNKSEHLIGQLAQRGIVTSWAFLKPSAPSSEFLMRGQSQDNRIEINFHPYLFDPEIPDPYTYGDEIDTVAASIISHEAGHILDANPQKYVAGRIKEEDFDKQEKKMRWLILDVEKSAWKLGELLLMTCCISDPKQFENFEWSLFHDLKAYCLQTYKRGMDLS